MRSETLPVTKKSPIDLRPFRSKADHEREQSLESRYRNVAIPELVAILVQMNKGRVDRAA
jgi:hypothetical protein